MVVDIPLFKAKDNETPYLEKKELPKYDEILVKTVVVSNDNPKGEKEQEEDELKAENPENVIVKSGPLLIDNKTKSQKVIEFVTKTPPRRIKEKAIGIIALLSHPKLKFKPDFKGKKPVFNIELETTGYQAIASIQPFKNKN